MSKILPPKNNINDICDDEIRIVGDIKPPKSPQESLQDEGLSNHFCISKLEKSDDAIIERNHYGNLMKRKKLI